MIEQVSNYDYLKMFFGEPYYLTDKIIIYQPTIGDILEYGEQEFFSMLNIFISNTTSHRLALWDKGIDWNKISDYELFMMTVTSLPLESTQILFRDLDFSKFKINKAILKDGSESYLLINKEQDVVINEISYMLIADYLRTLFDVFPKVEKAKGKTTKEMLIQKDRDKLEQGSDPYSSVLLPLISGCLNHPGFKYKKEELKIVGIYEFMDSVKRLRVYESTTALLSGMYTGMIDTSKIDNKEFDFMRDLQKSSKN